MPITANSCTSPDRVEYERCIRRLFYVPTYKVQLHTPPPTYTSIFHVINRYLGAYHDDNLDVIYYYYLCGLVSSPPDGVVIGTTSGRRRFFRNRLKLR